MMKTYQTCILSGLSLALLAGCAGSGDRYPSLATRDAERVAGEFIPAQQQVPAPDPVASPDDLNALVAAALSSHQRFIADQPETERLVRAASGLGIESDARARAEVAMAGLTNLRSETYRALGDLDQLEVAAKTSFAPTQEIAAAQAEVARLVALQTEVIGSLQRELGM